MDSFELLASDNPDLVLIASIDASIRVLIFNAKDHCEQRDTYKSRMDVAQRQRDNDMYDYYLQGYLEEDRKYQMIINELREHGINIKECEGLAKATKR